MMMGILVEWVLWAVEAWGEEEDMSIKGLMKVVQDLGQLLR